MQRRAMTYLLLIAAALTVSACGYSAAADEEAGGPAKVEAIEDSDLSKVVLRPSAARRIGLETTAVVTGPVDRSLVVPGTVVASDGGGSMTVRVKLPGAAAGSVDAARPARILGLGGQDGLVAPAQAPPSGLAGGGGARYYRLDGDTTAHVGQRLRVQLAEKGRSERETVPYSAVIYWIDGGTWVYVRTAPLTFRRAPVEIDRVDGGVAVLRRGPPAGTPVVSVGGEELLGTEFEIEGE
jgi:multidrug efflux pump subunit AcrA (membrane-fusion protein)